MNWGFAAVFDAWFPDACFPVTVLHVVGLVVALAVAVLVLVVAVLDPSVLVASHSLMRAPSFAFLKLSVPW